MQSFYSSRILSKQLHIPLARFKRWSREFLPPDNLGGFQSGYARQYNVNEAFKVYLGGFLVHNAKLAVRQADTALERLSEYLPNLYSNLPENKYLELRLTLVEDDKGHVFCKLQNGARTLLEDDGFEAHVRDFARVILVGKILQRFVKALAV